MNYTRGNKISEGGEGTIYEVQNYTNRLIKIYKEKNAQRKSINTPELQRKLSYMITHQPTSLISQGAVAWPLDFVKEQGKNVGFVMPKLIFDASLQNIYSYKHPLIDKNYADFPSVKSRIGIAINLASILIELHKFGFIVGDLNHDNIGVNRSNAQISIVDCDSFHIIDNNRNIMRTNVVMEGYLAPEIIAHCNHERANKRPYTIDEVAFPTFSKNSDLFCLAIHIFKSLMNGTSPFLGVKENARGSNAAPFIGHEGVERNNYVFKQGLRPSAVYCIAYNELPNEITLMFDRAFINGHSNPDMRPSAEEWYKILISYMTMLKQCPDNKKHQYYNKLNYCPYCEADKRHLAAQQSIVPIPPPPPATHTYILKWWKGIAIAAGIIIAIILFYPKNTKQSSSAAQQQGIQQQSTEQQNNQQQPKADYPEGQWLDADGNGKPDFVVRNGRLIGTVSGNDFGPATTVNFNSRKITDQDIARNWQWRDENWMIEGISSSVMVFETTIINCTGFTFGLKIITNDSSNNNFTNSDLGLNWPIYVWSGNNDAVTSANRVGDIKITQKDTWIYADITFSSRNVKWILFHSPRHSDGSFSGYYCSASISRIKR